MMSPGLETARRTTSRMASLPRSARAARQSAAKRSISNIGVLLAFEGWRCCQAASVPEQFAAGLDNIDELAGEVEDLSECHRLATALLRAAAHHSGPGLTAPH